MKTTKKYYDETLPEFPLTKEQLLAYLDWAETHSGGAGYANDGRHCPLAEAYRHHHHAFARVGAVRASVDGGETILTQWQRDFREAVDEFEDTYESSRTTVSVAQCRRILADIS